MYDAPHQPRAPASAAGDSLPIYRSMKPEHFRICPFRRVGVSVFPDTNTFSAGGSAASVDATDCAKKSRFLCSVRSHSFILAPFSPTTRASGARSRCGGEGPGMRGQCATEVHQLHVRSGAAPQLDSARPCNPGSVRLGTLARPNTGRGADHTDGPHPSDVAYHRPQ